VRVPLFIAVLLLAGCLSGSQGSPPTASGSTTSSPTSWTPPHVDFDGQKAHDAVAGLVLHADGTPRLRIPGTASHDEAGLWLHDQLAQPGWQVHWQNFTAADYRALPKSSAIEPYTRAPWCTPEDDRALTNMTFQNLYAVLPGTGAVHKTVLLAAHWDSQPASNNDPDPQKRRLPDPAADDGGSGVGLLVELVRELSAAPRLPFDVGVFLTDGEDGFYACYPVAGTLVFTHANATKGLADRFLLLDMVGDLDARFPREAHSIQSDPALVDVVWRHGVALAGPDRFNATTLEIEDDHVPFIDAGVPSIDVIDAARPTTFPPYWDTTDDTMVHVSPVMLGLVGQTLLDSLRDPAFVAQWPGHTAPTPVPPPPPPPTTTTSQSYAPV